jgi:PRTRC genetic system protein A
MSSANLKAADSTEMSEEIKRQFYRNAIDYITDRVDLNALQKNTNYAVQGDGIYAIVKNRIGKFILKMVDQTFPGLPTQFNGSKLVLDVPKIPEVIYWQIRQFFTDISKDMGEAEAFCQVYYDQTEKRYVVHVPEQTVSKASVNYDATENLSVKNPDRYILVFEIHSHNTMNAFWSGTDDSDEKETRFYGVLGNLDKDEIGEKFRTNILGKYVDLTKEHIFDFSNKIDKSLVLNFLSNINESLVDTKAIMEILTNKPSPTYPKMWLENIKKPSYRSQIDHTGGGSQPSFWSRGYGNDTGWGWDEDEWSGYSSRADYSRNWSGGTPTTPKKVKKNQKTKDLAEQADGIKDPDETTHHYMMEQELLERFSLDTVEFGWEEVAIQCFVKSLAQESVPDLFDCLLDMGYEEEIHAYFKTNLGKIKK